MRELNDDKLPELSKFVPRTENILYCEALTMNVDYDTYILAELKLVRDSISHRIDTTSTWKCYYHLYLHDIPRGSYQFKMINQKRILVGSLEITLRSVFKYCLGEKGASGHTPQDMTDGFQNNEIAPLATYFLFESNPE